MKYILFLVLFLCACEPPPKPEQDVVDIKFCLDVCVDQKISLVAGSASSSAFLGSAVSIKGGNAYATDVFKWAKNQCDKLFEGEKCCKKYSSYYRNCNEVNY